MTMTNENGGAKKNSSFPLFKDATLGLLRGGRFEKIGIFVNDDARLFRAVASDGFVHTDPFFGDGRFGAYYCKDGLWKWHVFPGLNKIRSMRLDPVKSQVVETFVRRGKLLYLFSFPKVLVGDGVGFFRNECNPNAGTTISDFFFHESVLRILCYCFDADTGTEKITIDER